MQNTYTQTEILCDGWDKTLFWCDLTPVGTNKPTLIKYPPKESTPK